MRSAETRRSKTVKPKQEAIMSSKRANVVKTPGQPPENKELAPVAETVVAETDQFPAVAETVVRAGMKHFADGSIDPTSITSPVMTPTGWLCPEPKA